MKVVALISGGKDSCYNMMLSVANGHSIVALANLKPRETTGKDELDSFMYQTVGHDAIHHYAECMGLPLFRREIKGGSVSRTSDYRVTKDDETEDLFALLKEIKTRHPDVEGVSVGAILSNYQRVRVEHVCRRLGLTALAYLWRREQKGLLKEMIEANVEAIIIKVAAIGLDRRHLGKTLREIYPHLCDMHERYDLHICGEGGEYETFSLDCPLFIKKIVVDETEEVIHSNDAFAPVVYLRLKKLRVVEKQEKSNDDWKRKVNAMLIAEGEGGDASVVRKCVFESTNYFSLQSQSHPGINRDIDSATMALAKARISSCAFKKQNTGIASSRSPYHFISGCTAYDTDDNTPEALADVGEETRIVMQRLDERLFALGLSWQNVVMAHVFVADMNDFGVVNEQYGKFFDVNPPARSTVQLDLAPPVKVQIDCIVVEPGNPSNSTSSHSSTATSENASEKIQRRFIGIERTETMHVQGISMWAPANIGPYSQAYMSQGLVYLAGQIGLVPNTMSLPSPPYSSPLPVTDPSRDVQLLAEVEQSLLNLKAVVEAMGCRLESDTALCVCYVATKGVMSFEKAAIADRKKVEEVVMGSWEYLREALTPLHSTSSGTPTPPPPMLCVWVPALPRGARVEWEVILGMPLRVMNTCDGGSDEESAVRHAVGVETDQLYDEKGLKVRCRTWSRGTVHIGKLTGCVLPTFLPKHIQEYAGDLVGKLVAGIGFLMQTLRIQPNEDAISFRVYYSVISRATVVGAFEKKLGSAICGTPTSQISITYVPVLKVGNYGLITIVVQAASVRVDR